MFGKGRGVHNSNCQCGVCRGNNMQDQDARRQLVHLVGNVNVQAAKEAERFGYLEEFSPSLAEAIKTMPLIRKLWEAL